MKKNLLYICLFLFLNFGNYGFSQKIPDSLLKISYERLQENFFEVRGDSTEEQKVAKYYLAKAKKELDTIHIVKGYQFYNMSSSRGNKIKYTDSIIIFSQNFQNNSIYPTVGYISRASENYKLGNYQRSLDDFFDAKSSFNINTLSSLKVETLQGLSVLNGIAYRHEEALAIHMEILSLLEKDRRLHEIYILTVLGNITREYIRLKKLDSADHYIEKGIYESLRVKDSLQYYSFVADAGHNEYYKGNYKAALDSLDKAFPYKTDQNDRINHYLYKGKIAKDLGNLDEAITHFEKLDSIYEVHQDPVRELPEVYQTFIDYYKEKGDIQNQLKYINKFIAADSILDANFNYLNTNITKQYDIPLLISEKETLISKLKNEKRTYNVGLMALGGFSILIIGLLFYNIKKRRFYKQRFEEILTTEPDKKPQENKTAKTLDDISKEVIENIQKGLRHFEEQHEFLETNITLNSLSKKLDTNSNYLSKVINHYQQNNFSNYLNDLRIEYAVRQLKNNAQFRRYSVKGMAQEVGFSNAMSFSKAFHKRTGLYPSYFLKQLEKRE